MAIGSVDLLVDINESALRSDLASVFDRGTFDVSTGVSRDDLARMHEQITAVLSDPAHIDAVLDPASARLVRAELDRSVDGVRASVVATPDVVSAKVAEEIIDGQIGSISAGVIARADLGSAQLAEQAIRDTIGTVTVPVASRPAAGVAGAGAALGAETDASAASVGALGGALGGVVAKAGLFAGVVGAAGVGLFQLADAASAVGEATNVTNVIFGDGAAQVQQFAKDAQAAIGQSNAAVLEGAGTLGTFGKAAGLQGKDLAGFSTGLLSLSSDIASFRNAKPEDVVNALGAALRGESEPIRAYGVLLDDATVKAAAYAAGIAAPGAELTQQQQILGRYQAILGQTTDAQGDFARTVGESTPNQLRVAQAGFDNFLSTIGQGALPIVSAIATSITPILSGLAPVFSELIGAIGPVLLTVLDAVKPLGEAFIKILQAVTPLIGPLATLFSPIALLAPVLTPVLTAVADLLVAVLVPIVELVSGPLQLLSKFVAESAEAFKLLLSGDFDGFIKKVSEIGRKVVDSLGGILSAVGTWITDEAVPFLIDKAPEWIGAFIGWVGDMAGKIPGLLVDVLSAFGSWILNDALPFLAEKGPQWIGYFLGWTAGLIVSLPGRLADLLTAFGSWIVDTALPWIAEKAAELGVALFVWVKDFVPTIPGRLADIGRGILDFIIDLPGKIVDAAKGFGSLLFEAGKDLLRGLWNGILDVKDWILDKIGGLVDGIVGGFKDALGISSPSKVFAVLGGYTMQGFAEGLTAGSGVAITSATTAAQQVTDAFVVNPSTSSVAGAAFAGQTTGAAGTVAATVVVEVDGRELARNQTPHLIDLTQGARR